LPQEFHGREGGRMAHVAGHSVVVTGVTRRRMAASVIQFQMVRMHSL
jgi:hypothetical protein